MLRHGFGLRMFGSMSTDYLEQTSEWTQPDQSGEVPGGGEPDTGTADRPEDTGEAQEGDDGQPVLDPAAKASRPNGGRRSPRGQLRRVAGLALALRDADAGVRELAADLVGAGPDDVAGLAVAVFESAGGLRRRFDDIVAIASAEPMEAVIGAIAAAENHDRFKAAWDMLAHRADLPGRVPAAQTKAGAEFAKAAQKLTDDDLAALRAPLDLVG